MTLADLKAEAFAQVDQLRRERDEARASVAHFRNAVREKERLELEAVQKLDEARAMLSAICSEFEGAVAHADWRAAGSPGMSVPFTGDFASATQLPSVVGRMRWWAREMRKSIGEKKS